MLKFEACPSVLLDYFEFAFKTINEGGFFGNGVAGLFDEMSWSFIDVTRIKHTRVKCVELVADGENALFEVMAMFRDH